MVSTTVQKRSAALTSIDKPDFGEKGMARIAVGKKLDDKRQRVTRDESRIVLQRDSDLVRNIYVFDIHFKLFGLEAHPGVVCKGMRLINQHPFTARCQHKHSHCR